MGSMGDPDDWLHVVSYWNEEDGLVLIVDDLRFRSHGGKADSSYERQDLESVLQLGDHRTSQSKKYEIAVHSLTIWERTLTVDEVEIFFTKGIRSFNVLVTRFLVSRSFNVFAVT